MNPRLIAISGTARGTMFALDADEVSIGREADCGIRLNHPSVSRRHCVIKREGDRFTVSDLDSYNGTFISGVPVKEQTLAHADQIEIGDIALLFLLHETEEQPDMVQLDDTNIVTQSTMQLRREDAIHHNPDRWLS